MNIDAPQAAAFVDEVRKDVPDALRHELTVEAQIMDWADDVAYSVHNLEDWLRAGYMPVRELVKTGDRDCAALAGCCVRAPVFPPSRRSSRRCWALFVTARQLVDARLGRDLRRWQDLQADIALADEQLAGLLEQTPGQILMTLPGVAVVRAAAFSAYTLPIDHTTIGATLALGGRLGAYLRPRLTSRKPIASSET